VSGLALDAQGRRGLLALGGVVLVVGLVGGAMLGGLRRGLEPTRVEAKTPAIKRQPPPPPIEVAPLAPSDQARFRDRAGMRQLLDQGSIHPARFPSVWRRVHLLALKGALPPQLLEEPRLLGIRAAYREDQGQGCRQLEALLGDLREALGEGGAPGDP